MSELDSNSNNLIQAILKSTPGYEARVFNLYSQRLTDYASTRMPNKLNGRVDSDDIVQSVFRSFFRRNRKGEFSFFESLDLWKLLVAMTYRKVINNIKFHTRDKRNVGKEGFGEGDQAHGDIVKDLAPGPEQVNIMADYMNWILSCLPEENRQIVCLRLEGYSVAEIAEQSNVSQRTVKRVMSRVRNVIRQRVENELDN